MGRTGRSVSQLVACHAPDRDNTLHYKCQTTLQSKSFSDKSRNNPLDFRKRKRRKKGFRCVSQTRKQELNNKNQFS